MHSSILISNGAWITLGKKIEISRVGPVSTKTKPDQKIDRMNSSIWKKMDCSQWRTFGKIVERGHWDIAELLSRKKPYTEVPKTSTIIRKIFNWNYQIDNWVLAGLFSDVSKQSKKLVALLDRHWNCINHPSFIFIRYSVTLFQKSFHHQTQTNDN